MEEHILPRIDLLKMDIEGAEASIFSRDAHPEQFLPKMRFLHWRFLKKRRPANRSLDTLHESEFEMSFHGETLFGLNRRKASGQEVGSAAAKRCGASPDTRRCCNGWGGGQSAEMNQPSK